MERKETMRSKMIIIALLSVLSLTISAKVYTSDSYCDPAIQSQQIMSSGVTFNGVVYEPFDDTAPSEYISPIKKPSIRRDSQDGRDPGDATTGSNQSPIGDGVWAMLFCALAFAGVIALRRRAAKE